MSSTEKEIHKTASGSHRIMFDTQHNMLIVYIGPIQDEKEYLDFNFIIGDKMAEHKTGKVLVDISQMRNLQIKTRVAAAMQMPDAFLKKTSYLTIAFLLGDNLFENTALRATIKSASKISRKFTGKTFTDKQEAIQWLTDFTPPK